MKLTSLVALGAVSSLASAKTYYETVTYISTVFGDVSYAATASPNYVTQGASGVAKHKASSPASTTVVSSTTEKETTTSKSSSSASAYVKANLKGAQSSSVAQNARMSSSLASMATSSDDVETTVSAASSVSSATGDVYADISDSPGLNETFAKIILDYHNKVRRIHQSPEMSWNKTLWKYAQEHADSYVCGSGLKHTGGPFGENLLAGGSDPTVAAPSWYSEEKDWVYGVNGTQYSHFSQMVWKATTQLGCAYKYCDDYDKSYPGFYVICNYYKFGNVLHTQAKQVLAPIKSLEYLALTDYN